MKSNLCTERGKHVAKKILLISDGKSLIINAIIRNMEKNGYEAELCRLDVTEIDKCQQDADIYILYLNGDEDQKADALIFLKDLCTEKAKLLIILGNPVDIESVEEYIPKALVSAVFERPVQVEALMDELAYLEDVNASQARLKHILLVDDDETFLKTIKDWLTRQYRVTIVTSGAQVMMYVAENRPDLILLDYEMPVTSGPKVLEMLRSERKLADIPVIFLTGKGDRESVMQVLSLKPEGYILKSLDCEKLLAAVAAFFDKQIYSKLHK